MRRAEEWAEELQKLIDSFALEYAAPPAEIAQAAEEYPEAWRRFARAIQADVINWAIRQCNKGQWTAIYNLKQKLAELEAADAQATR